MGLKVSRQACNTSDPCSTNPGVSGCINDSNLKSVGVGSHKLQKDAADGFIKMYADMPADIKSSVKLSDSYRPLKVQCNIFDFDHYESTGKRRKKGTSGTPVATPGGSNHGWGRAIDISPSNVQKWIKDNGTKYGWCWGEVKSESWHFTFCGPGPNRDKNCDSFCTGKMTVNTSTKSSSSDVTDKKSDTTSSDVTDKKPDTTSSDVTDKKPDTEIKTNDKTDPVNDFDSLIKDFVSSKFNIPKKDEPKDKEEVVAEGLIQEIYRIKDIMKKIL
jgi:hypothetical protein